MVPADHSINILAEHCPTRQESAEGAKRAGGRNNGPAQRESEDEAGNGVGGRVADYGGEGREKDHGEDNEPAGRVFAP